MITENTKVTELGVPSPPFYQYAIYNMKQRKYHKGGNTFRGARCVGGAKLYLSSIVATNTILKIMKDSETIEDYKIVEYLSRATMLIELER